MGTASLPAKPFGAVPRGFRADQLQRHYVNPQIEPDFTFGVLRRKFAGLVNDTVAFGWAKLHPIRPAPDPSSPAPIWRPSAVRYDVLLPDGASDLMLDPKRLLQTFQDQAVVEQDDLADTLKLTFTDAAALHVGWEIARDYARLQFVRNHKLPVLIILHDPAMSGTRHVAAPHVHIMALARKLGPQGFGAFCTIANDEAHPALAVAWRKARA